MFHAMMLDATGGSHGIRDNNMLESAINMPFATFMGDDLYPYVEDKAARLGFGIINNHPFVDGNKRTGLLAMLVFLETNGVFLTYSDEELVTIGLNVASGEASDKDMREWINKHKKSKRF